MSLEDHPVGNALRERYWGPLKGMFHLWRPTEGPLVMYGLFEKINRGGEYDPVFTVVFNTLTQQQRVAYTCIVDVSRCRNPDSIADALNVPVFAVLEFVPPPTGGQTLLDWELA